LNIEDYPNIRKLNTNAKEEIDPLLLAKKSYRKKE